MNIEEVLDDVARHLDFVYATEQFSIRDNEMKEMLIEINILRMENKKLKSIIKEVREYIEDNSLYEQDYDYDYEENLTEYPPSDEQARKNILSILEKENK